MKVSIIIPIYNPDPLILKKILQALKQQNFSGKYEIIQVDKGLGLAASINYGIRKARYEIIVTLHQDCIPAGKDWLSQLVTSLKKKDVVASVSKVHLPESLWKTFDKSAQALTIKEHGEITPLMDEKGCAYRKETLKRVGYFNEHDFRTAGEDFDMYLKLIQCGKIAYPAVSVLHIHPTTWKKRLKKIYQNANGYGALVRKHRTKMLRWYAGIFSSMPFLGIFSFLISYPWFKARLLGVYYVFLVPIVHALYAYGFWKGYINGKQSA